MQSNQKIRRISSSRNDGHVFNDRCSWLWFSDVGRAALIAIVVGGAVALITGRSSTGEGANAGLIAPVVAQPSIVPEDDSVYQPPRNPGSNDLTGS